MGNAPRIEIKLLRENAIAPRYMSEFSAGFDLAACVVNDLVIRPGKWAKVPTGVALAIPIGFEGEIRPRSGVAAEFGVTLLNSPGTIDSDYRGEVFVIIINHGEKPFTIRTGDRIAQLLIKPVETPVFEIVDELTGTKRGDGGFGSTGI